MDYEKLMQLEYGERGLVIRVYFDEPKVLLEEIRRKYREIKDFSQDESEATIYRVLGEVFCLSEDSVERCVKGKDINCCFYARRNDN